MKKTKTTVKPVRYVSDEEYELILSKKQEAQGAEQLSDLPPNGSIQVVRIVDEDEAVKLQAQLASLSNVMESPAVANFSGAICNQTQNSPMLMGNVAQTIQADDPLADKLLACATDDAGNADRFELIFGDIVRFNSNTEKWHIWDGRSWTVDSYRDVKAMAEEAMTRYREVARYHRSVSFERMQELLSHAANSCNNARLNALVDMLKHRHSICQTQFDQYPHMLNVANGIIDLRTRQLMPHDKNLLLSQLVDVPYSFNSIAGSRFSRFLSSIFIDDVELESYAQKVFGYGLTGQTGEQCMFLLWGDGSNGKTTLLEAIGGVVGNLMKHIAIETLLDNPSGSRGATPELAGAVEARIVVTSEMAESCYLNEPCVKRLTGQTTISARFLFSNPIEYTPRFKVFVDTNHLPKVRGKDYAIWRRFKVIPFRATFRGVSVDKYLPQKLQSPIEQQAILEWLVEGAYRYYTEGGLKDASSVLEATGAYQEQEDTIEPFLSSRTVPKEGSECPAAALFEHYLKFCADNGCDPENQTSFGRSLAGRGVAKKRTKRGNVYIGLVIDEV